MMTTIMAVFYLMTDRDAMIGLNLRLKQFVIHSFPDEKL